MGKKWHLMAIFVCKSAKLEHCKRKMGWQFSVGWTKWDFWHATQSRVGH
jgi:hypothetical protein